MRIIRLIVMVFLASFGCWRAEASTYYIDASNGQDSNTGLSPEAAWKTIYRVNQASFSPGDSVFFKRDNAWNEELTVPSSGSLENPIVFSVYGSSGEVTVTGSTYSSLSIESRSYLKFERICFRNNRIIIRDSQSVSFTYCIIRNSSEKGFEIENSSNISITNCNVTLNTEEGIYADGSGSSVIVRNSLIFGNGTSWFYGMRALNEAQITYDHNLISGNGYPPDWNLAESSGLVDGGNNLVKEVPKITSYANNDGYFVISVDDNDVSYWRDLDAILESTGVKFTIFLDSANISPSEEPDLADLYASGNEIAIHTRSHTSLVADTLFTITTSNPSPSVTINAADSTMSLDSSDTTMTITLSWAFESKTLQDLIEAVQGKNWTITTPEKINTLLKLSSLADSNGPDTDFPYTVRPDVSPPDYPFWRDEILECKSWIETQCGITPVTMAYPYGLHTQNLREYIKDTADLAGSRTTNPAENFLSHMNLFIGAGLGFSYMKGDGSENAIRANARTIFTHANQAGSIYVIYSHKTSEMSPDQFYWFVDEILKAGGKFYTYRDAMARIRSDHQTVDGYTYTKNYPDQTDFHLLPDSPCVNAGAAITHTVDYEGNPAPADGTYDIGAYEYQPPVVTYSITASAGENGTITPTGTVTASEDSDQTFSMTPADGYQIQDVLVDGASVGAVNTYLFSDVRADHTISVSFFPLSIPSTEIFGAWNSGDYNDSGSYNFRIPVPAETFSADRNGIRINIEASSNMSLTVFKACIGEKAASGDPYDMQPGTIQQITFDNGNGTVTIPAGTTGYSDRIAFNYDHNKDYIVSLGTSGGLRAWDKNGSGSYYWSSENDAEAPDVAYSISSSAIYALERLEVTTGTFGENPEITEVFGAWTDGDYNGSGNHNFRTPVPAETFTVDGKKLRIKIKASSTANLNVVEAYIGEKAAFGDPYDMKPGTVRQITFNTGSGTAAIPADTSLYSDWIAISYDRSKDYIVSIGTSGGFRAWNGAGNGSWYYWNVQNYAEVPDMDGYIRTPNVYALERMEISTAEPDTPVILTEIYGGWPVNDYNGSGNHNFRMPIPEGTFAIDGNSLCIGIEASSTANLSVVGAYFGEQAASGDPYDMEQNTIKQIFFDGGKASVSIPAGTTVSSDWISFSFNHDRPYIISLGTSGGFRAWNNVGHGSYYLWSVQDHAGFSDVDSYVQTTNVYALERMEVSSAIVDGAGKIAAPDGENTSKSVSRIPSIDCYPNPFNAQTTIEFTLPSEGMVRLTIYNIAGQKIRELAALNLRPGEHRILWDGRNGAGQEVSSGIYMARLQFGNAVSFTRMSFLK